MNLQINNLSAKISANHDPIMAAIGRVIASGWLVMGTELKQFEKSFAEYLGAEHCLGVANGTDAIELALRAMGVRQGDRVATVANAGMYVSTALLAIGAEPWFMDVGLDSRNATYAEVMRAVEAGVQAVVVTHLYGCASQEISQIAESCKIRGVSLLEDCAQAHGAVTNGKRVGTFGDAASFSFYPTKNLGALGDAGAVVTSHPEMAEKIMRLRQYGWSAKYRVASAGARNSRLDEIQAAILSTFLPNLDRWNARRREIANHYFAMISHPDVVLPGYRNEDDVAHLYVIRTTRRDELREHLQCQGVASDVHYPIPDHRQPVFGDIFANICLPNTEQLSREVLTLPCYPEMSDDEVKRVIEAINSFEMAFNHD